MVTQRGGAAYPQIRPQLQPETDVEPGELREIDGGSGLKARRRRPPAKSPVKQTYRLHNSCLTELALSYLFE